MKANKLTLLIMLFSLLVSCNGNKLEEPATGISGLTDDVYFEQDGKINSIGSVEHYELLIKEATEGNADDPVFLEYLQKELQAAEKNLQDCIEQSGANWDAGADGLSGKNRLLGYQYTTIRYKSIDHHNNPVMLSALVVWPFNNLISDPDANNVIIGCHVTIGSNAERPSNYGNGSIKSDVGMLACCARSALGISSVYDNLVIIPDYQGFGATHGEVHPYLSQDLTARQVLDGVRAGIAYYQQSHKLEKNWRSISTGYSQGGSVAMAVHRYIEKNNLESEFNFAGSVCGSGPYDPFATLKKYVNDNKSYMPASAAMMMYSMCNTSPRLMGKYSLEDFLTEEFLDTDIIKMIEEKKLNTDEMQEKLLQYSAGHSDSEEAFYMERLEKDTDYYHKYTSDSKDDYEWEPGYIRTAWAPISGILDNDAFLYIMHGGKPHLLPNKDYTKVKDLIQALEDNVLYRDWTPAHPIFLYHTREDEVVVVDNYEKCLEAWSGSDMVKGTIYIGRTETHVSYGSYFYIAHCGEGIRAIFDGKVGDYSFNRNLYGDF